MPSNAASIESWRKLVVVDQVLVAQRDRVDTLTDQGRNLVLDLPRLAVVGKALRKPIDQTDRSRRPTQQQTSGVRGHPTTVKRRLDPTAFYCFKSKQVRNTLCRHRGSFRR